MPVVARNVSRFRPLFSVGGCMLLALGGFVVGDHLVSKGPAGNFGLLIERADLDLADCWIQRDLRRTLHVRNTTTEPIEILRIDASLCRCLEMKPKRLIIPPTETRELAASLDLVTSPQDGNRERSRDVSVDFAAIIRGSPLPAHWQFSGRAHEPFIMEPAALDFEFIDVRTIGGTSPRKSVKLFCAPEIVGVSAVCDPHFGDLTAVETDRTSPARSYLLTLELARDIPLGPFTFEIGLKARDHRSEFATRGVRVTGVVVDDIEFIPAQARFGAARLGSVLRQEVIARSRTGREFTIEVADTGDADAPVIEDVVPPRPGKSHIITIAQMVQVSGLRETCAELIIRYEGGERRRCRLTSSIYGTSDD